MKKRFVVVVLALVSVCVYAQDQSAVLERRYNLLVEKVGFAGIGVETVLDAWERVDSTNLNMQLGRFRYYLTKGQTISVVAKPEKKYLGLEPVLTLKDSLGKDVYYFQEPFFDDALYGQAMKSLDKVISLAPDRLDFRFMKANAYITYEKESPDMTLSYLSGLCDEAAARTKDWTFGQEKKGRDFFADAMQEYCYNLFLIGTPSSREAFVTLSRKLNGIFPEYLDFLNNIGSYQLMSQDYKGALKTYGKVLKKDPGNLTALQNCLLAARRMKNAKLIEKYNAQLQKYMQK